jgi:hypothetical protein
MTKVNEIFPKVAICFVFFVVAVTILYKADKMGSLVEGTRNEVSNMVTQQLE